MTSEMYLQFQMWFEDSDTGQWLTDAERSTIDEQLAKQDFFVPCVGSETPFSRVIDDLRRDWQSKVDDDS